MRGVGPSNGVHRCGVLILSFDRGAVECPQGFRSELSEDALVFVQTQPEIADELAEKRADDDLGAVVRDHHDATFGVAECVVATFPTNPFEAGCRRYLRRSR